MNLYAYVGNNPLNATDPSGMEMEPYDAAPWYLRVMIGIEVHNAFQVRVQGTPGWTGNRSIVGKIRFLGRPDAVYRAFQFISTDVYELKPDTPNGLRAGDRQLNRYVRLAVPVLRSSDLFGSGSTVARGQDNPELMGLSLAPLVTKSGTAFPEFKGDGLIAYTFILNAEAERRWSWVEDFFRPPVPQDPGLLPYEDEKPSSGLIPLPGRRGIPKPR